MRTQEEAIEILKDANDGDPGRKKRAARKPGMANEAGSAPSRGAKLRTDAKRGALPSVEMGSHPLQGERTKRMKKYELAGGPSWTDPSSATGKSKRPGKLRAWTAVA